MADEGLLMQTKRGKWALPQLLGCVCGRVQGTRKGFAFLLPEDGSEDVFLPQDALQGAMHGDRALVRTFAPTKRGKGLQREGEVLRILQRARQTLVGTLEKGHYASFLTPEDRAAAGSIHPKGEDGRRAAWTACGGKNYRLSAGQPQCGGRSDRDPGRSGLGEADLLGIIRHYGLKETFETKTLMEAKEVPQQVTSRESAKREDFRNLLTVTIDGADARDFDDAISLERTDAAMRCMCILRM